MLQRTEQTRNLLYDNGESRRGEHPRRIDLFDIYGFLKSHRRIIIGWSTVCLVLALVYARTATPLYTASTDLTIDTRQINVFKNRDQPVGDNSIAGDSAQMDTQIEVLRSSSIALAIVKDLKLTNDPEFVGGKGSLLSLIFGVNEDQRPLSEAQRESRAVGTFRSNLSVIRRGNAYLLQISYRSVDPRKAARIANAAAEAYINEQLNNKYEAARRASIWLQERIADLRDQSNAAARAVHDYKEKNNIVDTGAGRPLLSDMQVQELNSQMIMGTAATAEAKAKLDRIQQVLNSPEPGQAVGTVSDTLHNEVIMRLRTKYLDDRQRVEEWSARMGPNHLAVISWRNEMTELQHSIVDELQHIAQSYQSDYEIAKTREDSIRNSLSKQIVQAGATGKAQVDLKELEAASETYHTIFETFLQKYTEAVQQQSFPISDAHVVTLATTGYKSYPKTTLVALLGLMVGLTAGLGHSLALVNFDRAVRRPRDVEERLGLECLGLVPLVRPDKTTPQPITATDKLKLLLPNPDRLNAPSKPEQHENRPDLLFKMVDAPFSHFSETIRWVKTTLDIAALTRRVHTIGVISSIPGEGKTTIAVNLAQSFSAGGHTALLIDADMRNPDLSRKLGVGAETGLVEVIAGLVPLDGATCVVPRSKLHFMPTFLKFRIPNSGDLLASERMREVLTDAQQQFDRIIIDLPPLGPISDSRAISPLLDAFIVVVRWGSTRVDVLEAALADLGVATDKIVGVVLNGVDYDELKHMDGHSGYYYNKRYAKYGYTYSPD
jgi:succinoglycan biosynthesis transport protein ExoP